MLGAVARWRAVALAAAVVVVLVAGCSDDDGDADGGDSTTTTAAEGGDGSTTEGDDATTESSEAETTTPAEGSGDEEAAAFCEQLIQYQEQAELAQIDTETEPSEEEVAEFKATFQEQFDLLTQLVADAPEEIAADLQAQLDALTPVNQTVQAAQTPADLIQAVADLAATSEEPAVDERATRISDWLTESCGDAVTE